MYNEFTKKVTDLRLVNIPVAGSQIDVNDLWLVSGVAMFFLLYFLRASLEQEFRNIKYVLDNKKEFSELVVMTQVFTPVASGVGGIFKGLYLAIWMLPGLLYCYVLYFDLYTYKAAAIYLGQNQLIKELFFETITVVAVGYMNLKCLLSQIRLQELLRQAPSLE